MTPLLISEVFPPQHGGSGRWLWEVYRRFPANDVAILAGDHPDAPRFDQQHHIRVRRAPLAFQPWGVRSVAGMRGYYRLVTLAARLARQYHCDQIHCARILPEGWAARLLRTTRRLPYLCYVHGEELHYGIASRELGWMMRRVLTGARLVIANSQNTRNLLLQQWHQPPARVTVLHPGVDTQCFTPLPHNRTVRQRLGWNDRPVILTVGRLQKRKGHDMLIHALPHVRNHFPNVLYAIVGDGDEHDTLQHLTRHLGLENHVQFLSNLDDQQLITCYQQCDLFALPNRQVNGDIEGFGMVLLEAQSCGKPVLAGDSGGTRETMLVGTTGSIVDCTSPQPLAGALIDLLQDEPRRRAMGTAARAWVELTFDWQVLATKAYDLMTDVPARRLATLA